MAGNICIRGRGQDICQKVAGQRLKTNLCKRRANASMLFRASCIFMRMVCHALTLEDRFEAGSQTECLGLMYKCFCSATSLLDMKGRWPHHLSRGITPIEGHHLPIQNRAKTLSKTSSLTPVPLTSPKAATASRRSMVQKSRGKAAWMLSCRRPRASPARVRASAWRSLTAQDAPPAQPPKPVLQPSLTT